MPKILRSKDGYILFFRHFFCIPYLGNGLALFFSVLMNFEEHAIDRATSDKEGLARAVCVMVRLTKSGILAWLGGVYL